MPRSNLFEILSFFLTLFHIVTHAPPKKNVPMALWSDERLKFQESKNVVIVSISRRENSSLLSSVETAGQNWLAFNLSDDLCC